MTETKITQALENPNKIPYFINELHGLTSPKSQAFLNTICSGEKLRVLEIGAYCGASSVAMLHNNDIELTVVDIWNEIETQPQNTNIDLGQVKNPKKEFLKNTKKYKVDIIEGDAFSMEVFTELEKREKFDIIFYDGPHDVESIIKFFLIYLNFAHKGTTIIVDDYNFHDVQYGIEGAKKHIGIDFNFEKRILTGGESKLTIWNGLYICII